ncbi:MAG: porin family protein [Spirochaetaceae bacterium]|nr:porin family protein [Spirochaetaceae bacterium]
MKKLVMLLCMAVCSAALFAQTGLFSVGGGAILVPSFQTEKFKDGGDDQKRSGFGGGLNLFFDATYAEVNINLLFANEKGEDADKGYNTTDLVLGVVGKYPFALGEKLSVFPFIGIDYRIVLGASYDGTKLEDGDGFKKADMFNALSVLFGAGVDYNITGSLYVRGELGFGITFNTKLEDDKKDYIDSNFKGKIPIKIAVGYRF